MRTCKPRTVELVEIATFRLSQRPHGFNRVQDDPPVDTPRSARNRPLLRQGNKWTRRGSLGKGSSLLARPGAVRAAAAQLPECPSKASALSRSGRYGCGSGPGVARGTTYLSSHARPAQSLRRMRRSSSSARFLLSLRTTKSGSDPVRMRRRTFVSRSNASISLSSTPAARPSAARTSSDSWRRNVRSWSFLYRSRLICACRAPRSSRLDFSAP